VLIWVTAASAARSSGQRRPAHAHVSIVGARHRRRDAERFQQRLDVSGRRFASAGVAQPSTALAASAACVTVLHIMSSSNDILDAARTHPQRGVRRVQLSEIARHAGVSVPPCIAGGPTSRRDCACSPGRSRRSSLGATRRGRPLALVAAIVATGGALRDDELLGGCCSPTRTCSPSTRCSASGTSQRGLLEGAASRHHRARRGGTIRRVGRRRWRAMVLLHRAVDGAVHRLVRAGTARPGLAPRMATALNGYLAHDPGSSAIVQLLAS